MQPQDIIKMIEAFCDSHKNSTISIMPGYCFEHIVLGDYNLYDGNIDFCLEKERIAEWIRDQAKDAGCLPGECDWWMLSSYLAIVDYAYSAAAFLSRLKGISEDDRDAAMEWYRRAE